MAQTYYATIDGTEKVKDSRPKLVANYEALRSNFNGASLPTSPTPIEGQAAFINGAWYTYNSGAWKTDDALHNHDSRYYTESEVNTLLGGYSAISHNHDAYYYTKTACDTLLAGKAATSHTHDDRYYTETEIDTKLGGYSVTLHNHDASYYTKTAVDTLLSAKAATSHTHDDRYYTEAEVDSKFSAVVSRSMAFYDTAGTYTFTVPAGVTKIFATGCGGGGGGGGAAASTGKTTTNTFADAMTGASGGSAGSFMEYPITVTPGQQITITVGGGGYAGAGGSIGLGGTAGGTGGTTSVGAYVSATGGGGGMGGTKTITTVSGGAGGVGTYIGSLRTILSYDQNSINSTYASEFNGVAGYPGQQANTFSMYWTSGTTHLKYNASLTTATSQRVTNGAVFPAISDLVANKIGSKSITANWYGTNVLSFSVGAGTQPLVPDAVFYGGGGCGGIVQMVYGTDYPGTSGSSGHCGFVMLEW